MSTAPLSRRVAELVGHLAFATFWGSPTVDLAEGDEVRRDPSLPAHKQPSCKRHAGLEQLATLPEADETR